MLDRFFNDSLASQGRVASFSPQVDAFETEQGFEIEASLPGLKRDEIKVDFQQGRLSISGERQFRNERNERQYHLVESSYGSFYRAFDLPDSVDANKIEATFEDGVLHVHVPKDAQKTMRHQIEVRSGQSTQKGEGNGSTGKSSGKMSERVGRDATDIPVQDASAAQRGGSQQTSPGSSKQGSGVGS
ncbi:Hsp20/alpha crystallin family protein [Hymenobacter sp. BT730]|uniref:Hsp20/alpha crystallin family protein n=1 Tax=Hymenobacter sp. BT730 TaxID=3063332 RepID=UPI0026E0D69F|nr:Hsp20/alpha crystallin family protein [Hymenobacter sp. BT730]